MPQQQRWHAGDLVQLAMHRGSSGSNMLCLTVNNEHVPAGVGGGEGSAGNNSRVRHLPAFQEWCWYLAFYRGPQVVAVLLQ